MPPIIAGCFICKLRNRGVSWKGLLLESMELQNVFSLRKACFHYYWNFCLVSIHPCCNQWIYSFLCFTFYKKMIYYEISFPLNLIFKYNFVKVLLLITFISIFISLKISDFLENKSHVFEVRDCTITVCDYFYYNELKI